MYILKQLGYGIRNLTGFVVDALRLEDVYHLIVDKFNPVWSRRRIMARVQNVFIETPNVLSFCLRPARRWSGFEAGQFITLGVEVNGIRESRCYSITSSPAEYAQTGSIYITVKRQADGKVSEFLHEMLKPGAYVSVSEAAGDFVLDKASDKDLLMVAAGSGITPVFSMLKTCFENKSRNQKITLIYSARAEWEVIFAAKIKGWADSKLLDFDLVLTGGELGKRIDSSYLSTVSDITQRLCFVCGPDAFMTHVKDLLISAAVSPDNIKQEAFTMGGFGYDRAIDSTVRDIATPEVRFSKAKKTVITEIGKNLLAIAEEAGLSPLHGCRMGICHTCVCEKKSGRVLNSLTGAYSEGEESIQLCVSIPDGQVELVL